MTRRRNKQGSTRRERAVGQQRPGKGSPASDGTDTDARERLEDVGKGGQVLPSSSEFVQTCCLLCHRERKDWLGSAPHNGVLSAMDEIPASFMPSLAQNLLGEMPLWICQSCRKSVEEEERQAMPEQPLAVSLSHTSCKSQSCGGGSHSSSSSSSSSTSSSSSSSSSSSCHGNSGDWDPSSFLSAHKLSGLWNSQHSNGNLGGEEAADCVLLGEGYHSEHNHHSDPSAPPNSPTGLASQPPVSPHSPPHPYLSSPNTAAPFSATSLSSHTAPSKATVCPSTGAHRSPHLPGSNPSLLKVNPPPPPLSACSHPCNGHCNGTNALQGGSTPGTTTRDATCRGHKFSSVSGCSNLQPCEADEGLGEDEDSSSERSSCTSSSTNQRDGKFCDCCYCEFFGHNTPPPAPTSRNYPEMREKLRSRLTKRKEEVPQKRHPSEEQTVDQRNVDELLDFINNSEPKATSTNKAAKRARHKLKKKEKALQEAGTQKSDIYSSSVEDTEAPSTGEKLLQWPQLELERVNSFLTSRLEEIKNTIKDSIRASFSVYDLNLDVNDFPKKAAVLEQKNLLSHLNGSSDLQEIDLDLSPLTLGVSKNQDAKLTENEVNTSTQSTENGVVKRLSAVPNLSRMIWVQSQKNSESGESGDKASLDTLENQVLDSCENQRPHVQPGASLSGGRTKKSKKTSLQTRKCESHIGEGAPPKISTSGAKAQRKLLLEKMEETSKQGPDTVNSVTSRPEKEKSEPVGSERTDARATAGSKSKAKKSRNKTDKPSVSVDDVFLPKDVDSMEMDETDREVEYFKRFCLDSAKQTRQKVAVNWTNFSLKKTTSNVAQ
ncbi:protein FAM193B isoform X2 [Rana temporaria]|uniref:protein FAM193B isoform X2 n=1 Tax=Rana temporaria TaxID=8407 RepID=UPI001AADEE2E|nr:protein FAM193B isoform X2 [Rana temporaria]